MHVTLTFELTRGVYSVLCLCVCVEPGAILLWEKGIWGNLYDRVGKYPIPLHTPHVCTCTRNMTC
jgi:hypothetical protein